MVADSQPYAALDLVHSRQSIGKDSVSVESASKMPLLYATRWVSLTSEMRG